MTADDALLASPARRFTQARARRTYERLVEAADALFADRGFDATQTPDIAAAAGVSVGTFYNYFTDKKEIYLEVVRRELAGAYHEIIGRLTPDLFASEVAGTERRRRTIRDTLAILLDHVIASPRRHRVLLEMSLRDGDVAALRRAFDRAAQHRLAELIAVICPRETVPDPLATAYVIHTAAVGCASQLAFATADARASGQGAGPAAAPGPVPVSRERAQAALSELIHRALFGIDGLSLRGDSVR